VATWIPAWGSIPPLARAAVCEIPLMEEPDFDVLHTLVRLFYRFVDLRKRKTNVFKVLYDLVSLDILRQQESRWLCLESDGFRCQTCTRSELIE